MIEQNSAGKTAHVIAPGDWVYIEGMGGIAEVLELDPRRGRARVRMEDHEWVVPMERLTLSDVGSPVAIDPRLQVRVTVGAAAYHEIDLHGMYVEEALEAAERGLDQAVVHHFDTFKIIHGHGTGRVRLAIRKMLDTHPHVDSYRFGEPHEGGLACTVVLLRRHN